MSLGRVLVVDDEKSTNTLAAEYLRLAGFEVESLFDGESALARLSEDPAFDAVVLDKRMPGLDGLEVCAALKEDPRTSAIPVILLSASINPAREEPVLGAAAVMTKPFSPKDLVALLRRLLA